LTRGNSGTVSSRVRGVEVGGIVDY
jgi:hypothetical protein